MGQAESGYGPDDRLRWVAEPPKRLGRTDFARDRARVLHSAAWRRLAAKTQVVVAGQADFPRNRMTHSLECAQVGRELGDSLGCDPDLVEAACLAHDLGHPPFGHNGEQELDRLSADIGGFEGNAQTLRILSRLEAKTFGRPDGAGPDRSVGLNLCRATLDAATKYPWPRQCGSGKYGVYDDDVDVFLWLRAGAPVGQRSFEAQIMDWADDVAYSVHDVEDGIHAGHIPLARLGSATLQAQVVDVAVQQYAQDAPRDRLARALQGLLASRFWPQGFAGSHRDLAGLKNLTSDLIGRFTSSAEHATREHFGGTPLTRYGAQLVIPVEVADEVALLKALAYRFVMQRRSTLRAHARERQWVADLVGGLAAGAPAHLEPQFAAAFLAAPDERGQTRVIIDQVASLTDLSVPAWLRRLAGRTAPAHPPAQPPAALPDQGG